MIDDLLRLFPLVRNLVGVSKTRPNLSRAFRRYCLLEGNKAVRKTPLCSDPRPRKQRSVDLILVHPDLQTP